MTTYKTTEERTLSDAQRLAIEMQAHNEMQAMYEQAQREITLLRLQLSLERQGGVKTSENYTALLYIVSDFIFSVKTFQDSGSPEDALTEKFSRLEAYITGAAPEIIEKIEIDHDTLAAEIEAGNWADERIASLEDMIAAVWSLIISGDDPTECEFWKDFEAIAKARLGADDDL